ncbi:MAG TPA: hypothetical protein VJS30_07725 [Paraburkholderia sp.]|nr:hypothetical protein [Paraburkholderia sp.]
MVIVLVIVVFVVMASDITRAVPWMFETEVIWGIVAIGIIYTKTVISRGRYPHFPLFTTRLAAASFKARATKKGHA